jgi:superfamily II DNA or RNA helicase
MDMHCPVCDIITTEEALGNGWISPVKQYLVLLEVDDINIYEEANQQFLHWFSYFNNDFGVAMKMATDFRYRAGYIKQLVASNPSQKEVLSKQVHAAAFGFIRSLKQRKEFIYNHQKKIEIANLILEHRQDRKAITFWKTIKMAEQVKYGYVLHSGQTKKRRAMTMTEFNNLNVGVINSSRSLVEGVDIPHLNLGIIGGLDSSKTTKTQAVGRICRFEQGKEAELFVLVIKDTVEIRWFNNSNTIPYTTLTEQELNKMLIGEEYIETRNKKSTGDIVFRF